MKKLTITRKHTYFFIGIVFVSLLTQFLLLPVAQASVNGHWSPSDGELIGLAYLLFAVFCLIKMAFAVKNKDIILMFLHLMFVITFVYWTYRLWTLYCIFCIAP